MEITFAFVELEKSTILHPNAWHVLLSAFKIIFKALYTKSKHSCKGVCSLIGPIDSISHDGPG